MVYLLRHADGTMQAVHDQHVMGLFPRAVWLAMIADAGFQSRAVPFDHSSNCDAGHDVFSVCGSMPVYDRRREPIAGAEVLSAGLSSSASSW